ncbi:MAG TPA: GNAT family N-acetyltransferase [Cyclobacteriaceae bacterium]|jgi:hypothetical protein|nr:GNAT family N-acetyltransferase [Cyclobacteriaceae bacterium]
MAKQASVGQSWSDNMITIKRYTEEDVEQWNEFIQRAKNATFLFNRAYMDYHRDRFTDHSLLISKDSKLVAVLPANEKDGSIYSHGGLSYGGLILELDVRLEEVLCYFFHLLKYYNETGIGEIIYKCFPSYLSSFPAQEDMYAFHLLNAELVRRDSGCVSPLAQQLTYQNRRIRAIKKAEKAGVWVKEIKDPSFFWNHILTPTLEERHQLKPVHSLDEIRLLSNRFPDSIRFFEAGVLQATAGAVIYETFNTAHAQYIAATSEGRDTGAIDLLFHRLLTETFKDKQFFSFGISNEDNGKHLNRGLQDWKEGFGGRTIAQDFYKIQTKNYTVLNSYA